MTAWKACRKCGEAKPQDEFRPQRRSCRECDRVYNRAYYLSYYQENRERKIETVRSWIQRNREWVRARDKAHRDQLLAERPHLFRTENANWRARTLGVVGQLTETAVGQRWEFYAGRCWMCGGHANEIDHVKALSKGGPNLPSNVRPACGSCNKRKMTRLYPKEMVAS